MQLTIGHATQYDYDAPVEYALQKVRLRPVNNHLQTVMEWTVAVDGGKIEAGYTDHYGNHVDLISAHPGTRQMILRASGTVQTHDRAGVLGFDGGGAPPWHFAQATALTQAGEGIRDLAAPLARTGNMLDHLHALSAAILAAVPYAAGYTGADTTAEEAVAAGHGVCQDHANIFASAVRLAGLPARYVSGYLMMNDRVDQDASHAWAEVHLPDLGWVGFDVSNGVAPDERYVRIAVGRDAHDAAPISGIRRGQANETMQVSLQVQQ